MVAHTCKPNEYITQSIHMLQIHSEFDKPRTRFNQEAWPPHGADTAKAYGGLPMVSDGFCPDAVSGWCIIAATCQGGRMGQATGI